MQFFRFVRGQHDERTHRQPLFLQLLMLFLLIVGSVGGPGFSQKTAEAWYPTPGILPGSDTQVFWPDVAVDSGGMVHAVWHDLDGQEATAVGYAKGQFADDGSTINWISATPLSTNAGLRIRPETAHIVTDKNNTVHIVMLSKDYEMYYFYSTTRGDTWQAEKFRISKESWHPDIGVDDNGTPYITWSTGVGDGKSHVWYSYRVGENNWLTPQILAGPAYLMRENNIAVSTIDGQPTVHILYDQKSQEGGSIQVAYLRGYPTSFTAPVDFTANAGVGQGDNAFISADETVPGLLYASFVTGSNDTDYVLVFAVSQDNGASWPGLAGLNLGGNIWPESSNIFGYNGNAHIVSEEKYWDGDGIETIEIWYRLYNIAGNEFSRQERISPEEKSSNAAIDGGGPGKFAIWVKGNTDNIKYSAEPLEGGSPPPTPTPNPPTPTPQPPPTPTPIPQKPVGRIQVGDGSPLLAAGETSVSFLLDSGKADEYKLWNTPDAESAFQDIPNIAQPLQGPGGTFVANPWNIVPDTGTDNPACVDFTVNGKLRNSGTNESSDVMSVPLVVDPGVDAAVTVQNPGEGAAAYTNELVYMLEVQKGSGECSNIVGVRVGEKTAAAASLAEADLNQTMSGLQPLSPAPAADHTIVVEVTDGVGHAQSYERVITVDTESPQLHSDAATFRAGDTSDMLESVLVDLHFTQMSVTDNLYGSKDGEEMPFWGVQVANSREDIPVSEGDRLEQELNWQAVAVTEVAVEEGAEGRTYTFTLPDWNLTTNLATTEPIGGSYYVYARVMDGAGNVSTEVLQSNEVQVSENVVMPTTPTPMDDPQPSDQLQVYLPVVTR
jgi:hypothetical protein